MIPAVKSAKNIFNAVRRIPAVMIANVLVTRKCSQKCLQCTIPLDPEGKDNMQFNDFIEIVDTLDRHGTQFLSISGGEPLLHPLLDELIRYAAGKNFVYVQLLSNLFSSKSKVEKTVETLMETGAGIQTSFDGFGDVADKLRGGKNVAETVMFGIDLINRENKKRKKPIRTSVNIVINQLNLVQIPEILEYIENIGWKANVDLYRWLSDNHNEVDKMKITDLVLLQDALDWIRSAPFVTTPRVIIDGYIDYLNGKQEKRCPYLEGSALGSKFFIEPNGEVNLCFGEPVGNLLRQKPVVIFRSEKWHNRLRELEKCEGCWNTCYTPAAITFHPKNMRELKAIWNIARKG
ncbi:radical SAM/SPASM domain-containing protein [candidate division KSB1 bacterium]